MDALFGHLTTALGTALVTALACEWKHHRGSAALRRRAEQAEIDARAAGERAAQTRLQVRQLSLELAEQTRARKATETAQRRRGEAERALASSARKPVLRDEVVPGFAPTQPPLPADGFADTQPL